MVRSVLIVDDHQPFRAAAARLLTEAGFRVIGEAAEGTTAVELSEQLRPDIVLLDVVLPDIDGFEVAHRIERLAEAPAVVLVSSRDRSDYGALIGDAPAIGFIPKAELSGAALRRLLEQVGA